MGAIAFLMASFMGISYLAVMKMVIPAAALWYLGVLSYLYAHGRRNRHRIASSVDLAAFDDVPPWIVFKSALMGIIPVGTLIYALNEDLNLRQTTLLVFVVFMATAVVLRVERRWDVWISGIRRAAVMAGAITLTMATLRIFDISLTMTGLEYRLADVLYDLAAGNVLVAVGLMIIGGVLLGAALPPIAVFYVMFLTFTPVLVKFGVERDQSIFIAFYMGNLATIAPPVASGIILAASVAGVGYWKASWATVVMGLPLFFFPFLFVFSPELILRGDSVARTVRVLTVMSITLVYMETGTAGWFGRNLNRLESAALIAAPVVAFFGLYWETDLLLWVAPLAPLALGVGPALHNATAGAYGSSAGSARPVRSGTGPMAGYATTLDGEFPCPVCRWRFISEEGLLSHFASTLDGKGALSKQHHQWAKKRGVFRAQKRRERTVAGGPIARPPDLLGEDTLIESLRRIHQQPDPA